MDKRLLTIIAPIKNARNFLTDHVNRLCALASVTGGELLFIDNNEDESELRHIKRISEEYNIERVRLEKNQMDLGVHGSLQKALDMVETPYVTYVAADDLIFEGYVFGAIDVLNSHPGVTVVWGRQYISDILGGQAMVQRKNPFPCELNGRVTGNSLRAMLCNYPVDTGLIVRTNEARYVRGFENHAWYFELQACGDGYILDTDHFVNGKHPGQESKKMYLDHSQIEVEERFFRYMEQQCLRAYGSAGLIAARLFNSARLQGGQFLSTLESFVCASSDRSWSSIKAEPTSMLQLVTLYFNLMIYESLEERGELIYRSSLASTAKNPPLKFADQVDAIYSFGRGIGAFPDGAPIDVLRRRLFS